MGFALILVLIVFVVCKFFRRLYRTAPERRWRFARSEMFSFGLIYGAFLVVLLFFEKRLVFPASAVVGWDQPEGLKVEDVWLTTRDGAAVHGWWCPVENPHWVVHYSHGNAGNLSHRREAIQSWQRACKASVLIYDYPGYGRSEGAPDEASCVAAGQAAYDWLRREQKVAPEQLIIYGKSLGGGVATELAVKNPHRLLVLFCSFTSMPDMAQAMFPFFPARYLVQTQFDNRAKLSEHTGPVVIGHGLADTLIPFQHSQRLYDALPGSAKQLRLYPGIGHSPPPYEFLHEVAAFLKDDAAVAVSR
jgi:pimeloyl-ACP methyl ester carboxylesterase